MIPALAAASAAMALGGAVYGTISSSQANNKARRLIQQQRDENRAWYNTRNAEDYTMRSDVQAAIKKQREVLEEQLRRAQKTNTVAGGTDASLAVQQQAANRALSDTMTDVAGQASAWKDSIENSYRQQDAALNQQQVQNQQQQAQQAAQAGSQVVNAGMNLVGNSIYAKQSQA